MGRRRGQHCPVHRTHRKNRQQDEWYIRYRIDQRGEDAITVRRIGKTRFLGKCSEMTKKEAERLRDQILSEIVNQPQYVLQSQIPFGRVIDQFLEFAEVEVRPNTYRTYHSLLTKHFLPTFAKTRICDMTPLFCQQWLHSLRGSVSRAYRGLALRVFRAIWERAIEWGFTTQVCPLRRASLGPRETGRKKTLPTPDQFRAIVALLEEPYRSMLIVAAFTGLRVSEIRGLQWSDVHGDSLIVRRSLSQLDEVQETKSVASVRVVPAKHLKTILSRPASADISAFIFEVDYKVAQKTLRRAAKTAGVEYEGFGWHTFRRARKTWGRRHGESQADSMAQLGQSDAVINQLYYVEDDSDFLRRAETDARIFDAVMFGGKEGRA